MKKLTLCIPIFNQLNETKSVLGNLRHMTSDDTEWLFIDNGSTDPVEEFVTQYLKPKRMNYIRNEENIGLLKTMQQAYENCNTDLLAIIHNDVMIYEKDWDKRVAKLFEEIDKLGGVGFFGSQGCGPIGERIQDVPNAGTMAGISNMLEAELHGMRMDQEWKPVAIFDGLAMIFSMEMLKKGNGFDQRYQYHHLYDRASALQSLALGYKNVVINVPCHHLSGITANRAEYQAWIDKKVGSSNFTGDKYTHDENSRRFANIWKEALPLYVENDFSFRTGQQGQWDFKGDKILGYSWLDHPID